MLEIFENIFPDILGKNINIKILVQKLLNIAKQEIEYSQILDKINIPDKDIKLNIKVYEQKNETSISILDFESCDKLWNEGFNFTNVKEYEIK